MKGYMILLFLINFGFAQKKVPFNIDVKPRIIDGGKILVNVSVINNVERQIDYLEGFLSQFSVNNEFIDEKRMVILYSYEPPLKAGYSTYKAITYKLNEDMPSNFKFKISKVKFSGDNRVFAWHIKSGFIRID
jgi:hypothetical protein